jgi:FkbM family methyltransferase
MSVSTKVRMINRITASLIYRLGLPFQYVAEEKPYGDDLRALRELKDKLARLPRYTPGKICVEGLSLNYVDAPALIAIFEDTVVRRRNDFIARREDPLILDCGANIGVTVLHYKRLYPKARVVAFEPDKGICGVLRKNVLENGADNVEVVEAAIWTAAGEHTFLSEGADGSRLVERGEALYESNEYAVKTVRFADYLEVGTVDFVKLDIEGAESAVLADCANRLGNIEQMVMEFHLMNDSPQSLVQTLEMLSGAGFSLSVNSYGPWVDLAHPAASRLVGDLSFNQYLHVCAWRE